MRLCLAVAVAALALTACQQNGQREHEARIAALEDSLSRIISQKDAELNDIMGTFNDIQEGFNEINRMQGRINLNGPASERSRREDIMENLATLQTTLKLNRDRIERLTSQLKTATFNTAQLRKTIARLQQQMEDKEVQIQQLQAQISIRDAKISTQEGQIGRLTEDVGKLTASNEAKAEVVSRQDKDLHTAWYVFGTKRELKEQGIVNNGEALAKGGFNKDYLTRIDTRVVKSVKLYSKSAELLTTHPAGSYRLERDNMKQYTLYITDPEAFWSISRYLVVLVK